MTTRHAACSCGQLRLSTESDPIRVSICHCLACQRRTGSPFGAQARFRRSTVKFEGRSQSFVRVGDEGSRITFHFCPTCGSTVHYALEGMDEDDMVAVPVGAFADPQFPAPTVSVYEDRRHGWVGIPDDVEHIR
jgi:hypothetical protein